MYLSISFRKSTPPQNGQIIIYYRQSEYEVDGFVVESTLYNTLMNILCQINSQGAESTCEVRRPDARPDVRERGRAPGRDLVCA